MYTIGIAGGSGCGKTTVVRKIIDQLPGAELSLISQDSYYRDNSHIPLEDREFINFDHPDSLEFELLIEHLKLLKSGEAVDQPEYSYLSCTRGEKTTRVFPGKVLIVEGILLFTLAELRELFDLKLFVDAEPDDRLSRIIVRDIEQRGRDTRKVLKRYYEMVKPMHIQFIEPTKRFADLIIPEGGKNTAAINVLTSLIKDRLKI